MASDMPPGMTFEGMKGITVSLAYPDVAKGKAIFEALSATLERARRLALSGRDHLDRNDAYSFFAGLGDLLVTGPTSLTRTISGRS